MPTVRLFGKGMHLDILTPLTVLQALDYAVDEDYGVNVVLMS